MAVKLILSDIDATILPTGQRQVSERTREAFHAALAAGLHVGPASGRGYAWIPGFFGGDTACCSTALATNGMQVYLDGEKVLEKTLDAGALERVRQIAAETPHAGLLTFQEDGTPLLVQGAREDLRRTFSTYAETCVEAPGLPDFPVVKANVFDGAGPAEHAALVARLNAEVPAFDVDLAMPTYSNINPHGWNKGAAVTWLRERLGLGRDEVVVFGDGDNDLPMFAVVDNSVAVAGATPEAAAAARWHIGACEDDAVADAIEVLAAGGWPFTE
ncbi:HAD family hydrolase [Olsenella profusa]|uniref:HAD family phosphatase n=1 Tax=Olsenella profusa TaxID=138595 RepID=A0ABS2F123_9ACTN|nr:HAD family hydrolase [Olsenella profusa]MBM6774293.1 HAD family phosphatase [Olsenella profusa]